MVAVDATLQYDIGGVPTDVEGVTDAESPTGEALPTYDGGARAQLVTAVARLTSIRDAVDGLEGMLDGVETSLGTLATQATLASVLTSVDGLEASLTSILAAVDGLEGTAATLATQSTLAAVLTSVDTLETGLASLLTELQLKADLTETQPVKDDYQAGECLAEQTGAGAVLTFTFASPVQLVHVEGDGADTDVARVDPFGGTPSATQGFRAADGVGVYLPVICTVVKVYAPTGMVIAVNGFRRS